MVIYATSDSVNWFIRILVLGTIIYIRDHLLMEKDRVNIIEMERKKSKSVEARCNQGETALNERHALNYPRMTFVRSFRRPSRESVIYNVYLPGCESLHP